MIPIRYLSLISAAIAVTVASFVMPGTANAGGGCHLRGTSDAESTTVAMRQNCFVSTVTRVDEGATVTWVNEDDVAHNVTGAGYMWGGDNEVFRDGAIEHTFDENGVYPYACLLHPGMVGAIVVGDGSGDGRVSTAAGFADDSPRAGGMRDTNEAGSNPTNTTNDSDTFSASMIVGAIAIGVLLVASVGAGSFALARSMAQRSAAAR